MEHLLEIDRFLFSWINQDWVHPVLDMVMPWLTHLGAPSFTWLVILLAAIRTGRSFGRRPPAAGKGGNRPSLVLKKVLLVCLYFGLIYGLNAGLCSSLKHSIDRERPFEQREVKLRVSPETASDLEGNGSFPSGHTYYAFMAAALWSALIPGKGPVFYSLAGTVALSRIYLGVHFPADVLAGAVLGCSITRLLLSLEWLRVRITGETVLLSGDSGLRRGKDEDSR